MELGFLAMRSEVASPSGLILYVEDDAVNFLLIQQALSDWPALRVVRAENATEGARLVRALCPDLLLLDMELPDMSGVELLLSLEGELDQQKTTVAFLSASAMPQDILAAREAGVTRYWTKPIDIRWFREEVCRLLA